MGIPNPFTKEQAPAELHKIYDKMQEDIGGMPNIFGVVARFPAALKTLIQFYASEDNTLPWGFVEGKIVNPVEDYPVIIQIYDENGEAFHFAQTIIENDPDTEYIPAKIINQFYNAVETIFEICG